MESRYCLQMVSCGDGCCGNGNGGTAVENVYSTEETVCGTWIDGKTIYRKVISGTSAAESGSENLFANVSGLKIDKLVNLYGNVTTDVGQIPIPFTVVYSNKTFASFFNFWYEKKSESIIYNVLNQNGLYSSCPMYVVIEYTKQ